jgi:hypothetical protein
VFGVWHFNLFFFFFFCVLNRERERGRGGGCSVLIVAPFFYISSVAFELNPMASTSSSPSKLGQPIDGFRCQYTGRLGMRECEDEATQHVGLLVVCDKHDTRSSKYRGTTPLNTRIVPPEGTYKSHCGSSIQQVASDLMRSIDPWVPDPSGGGGDVLDEQSLKNIVKLSRIISPSPKKQ